jgi:hypothetical protein
MPLITTIGGGSVYGLGRGQGTLEYIVGEYYPIFAIKLVDDRGVGGTLNAGTSAQTELRMRSALSLNPSDTLAGFHKLGDSVSSVLSSADTFGVSINTDFGGGGNKVNGYRMDYHTSASSAVAVTAGFITSSAHNFYDNISNTSTNLFGTRTPSALGSISSITNGSHVFVNASTNSTRTGDDFWLSDNADYCFMGVYTSDAFYVSTGDQLDTGISNIRIAIGISDSDGTPASGQPPRTGISRRSTNYTSLVTVSGHTITESHSGNTGSGIIVLYGRYAD